MQRRTRKKIFLFLLVLAGFYLTGGLALYLAQDGLLFHPTPLPKDHRYAFDQPYSEKNIPWGKDNLNIVCFPALAGPSRGIVLFFHGNRYHAGHYKKYPSLFTAKGWEVWMIDYPGFGKSTGERSEQVLYQQALYFYQLASRQTEASRIIIYGKSIGTGIASYLAAQRPCKQLILETPYYSIAALARHYFPFYPVVPLSRYRFPIHQYLPLVKAPITLLHGTRDEIIPFAQSAKLATENPKATLTTIPGGTHNDLAAFPLFRQKLDSLLQVN